MTCSTKFSCARSRAASWRCSRAWCNAPAINRPITSNSSTSRAENSRRCTVCTLSTPTNPPGVGFHRHRHHRGEIRAAQRFEAAGNGVGLPVVADHHGLPVAGHPAGDAAAQREPDLADLAVERRGGAGQGERAFGVVENVHEADVGVGGVGDHPGGGRGEQLRRPAAGGRLDQLAQQREFAVGGRARCGRAVTGRSSRSAVATRTGAVTDAELAVDRAQVGLDGLIADHQLAGDPAVGQPLTT